jgi:general stress protein CsbA
MFVNYQPDCLIQKEISIIIRNKPAIKEITFTFFTDDFTLLQSGFSQRIQAAISKKNLLRLQIWSKFIRFFLQTAASLHAYYFSSSFLKEGVNVISYITGYCYEDNMKQKARSHLHERSIP